MADYQAAKYGAFNVLAEAALPSLAASANPFASAPLQTRRIVMSVRAFPINLRLDGNAATAGANGVDYPVGTYEIDVNKKILENARAIQNGGTTTGYLIFLG